MKNKKWKYYRTIEKMSNRELEKRIRKTMDYKIENKIKSIPYIGGERLVVEYFYPELQARCPMTGLKDLYKIRIRFIPKKFIPELKSLKFYFIGYEDLPILHEHLIAKIYRDFKKAVRPEKIAIVLYAASRGEIATTVSTGNEKLFLRGAIGMVKEEKAVN